MTACTNGRVWGSFKVVLHIFPRGKEMHVKLSHDLALIYKIHNLSETDQTVGKKRYIESGTADASCEYDRIINCAVIVQGFG